MTGPRRAMTSPMSPARAGMSRVANPCASRLWVTTRRRGASASAPIRLMAPACASRRETALARTRSSSASSSSSEEIDSTTSRSAASWCSASLNSRFCGRQIACGVGFPPQRGVAFDLGGDHARQDAHGVDLGPAESQHPAVVGAEGAEDASVCEEDRHGDVGAGADQVFGGEVGPTGVGVGVVDDERGQGFQHGVAEGVDALDDHRRGDAQADAVAGVRDDEGIAFEAVDHGQADADVVRQQRKRFVDALVEGGEGCGRVGGEGRQPIGTGKIGRRVRRLEHETQPHGNRTFLFSSRRDHVLRRHCIEKWRDSEGRCPPPPLPCLAGASRPIRPAPVRDITSPTR